MNSQLELSFNYMKKRILLVEDDAELAQLTQEYLENFDYQVDIIGDGQSAVDAILNNIPDLILLDIMLPELDGIEVCRKVRPNYHGSIIMLTARTEQMDQILGLEIGADDYLCKPVEPRLLLAKIKSHLRYTERKQNKEVDNDKLLSFDELIINAASQSVTVNNKTVPFSTPEFDLLWLLANNAGSILSRDHIFYELRGVEYDGQNRFVDILISHIRNKIGNTEQIKTIRGKGYIFCKK